MADDTLPVVFKTKTYQSLVVAAIGAVAIAWGLWLASGGVEGSVRVFRYGSVPAPVAGWAFIAIGLVLLAAGLTGSIVGCPILTIAEAGIAFKRCRGGTVRLAWTDLAGIRTGRIASLAPGQFSGVNTLHLVTKDGRAFNVGVGDETRAIEAVIRREAARRGAALEEV